MELAIEIASHLLAIGVGIVIGLLLCRRRHLSAHVEMDMSDDPERQ